MTRRLNITLFITSLVSFLIVIKLFWNMAIFVDEAGFSPSDITGGDFWLMMNWLLLLLLFILTITLGLLVFKTNDSK